MISIIVAIDQNNAIGQKGGLLCHLPNDLLHFKNITSSNTVIMGKRTYLSLPRRPLPNRPNIVISDIQGEQIEGAIMAYSIEDALRLANPDKENFIIGGGTIYRQFMPIADKLYITRIRHTFPLADTFFPTIDNNIWKEISKEEHAADKKNPYPYDFIEYIRNN